MNLKALTITNRFFVRNAVLHKSQGVFYVKGNKTRNNPPFIASNIKAHKQPMTAQELAIMSEGERTRELIKIYTESLVKVSQDDLECDILEIDNKFYKAIKVYDRNPTSGLYKVILDFLPRGLPT